MEETRTEAAIHNPRILSTSNDVEKHNCAIVRHSRILTNQQINKSLLIIGKRCMTDDCTPV